MCASSNVALGQGGVNGSILGSVFDQTGQPLKGVKITARSPTQIGGPKTTYSNDEGNFRLPGLQPGTFEVTASAPKLKTVLQKDINVGVNAPAEVSLMMEVEAHVEEVKVIEKAPVVSTTSAKVVNSYDEEFINSLPVPNRNQIENIVGNTEAGAVPGPSRNANQARVRGGGTEQTEYRVDGFNLSGRRITFGSQAAFEVSTAGYGADGASVPGGMVSMVTKSGSNKFEIALNSFAEDSNFKLFASPEEQGENHSWLYYVNPSLSGPIVKDRLWFYASFEGTHEGQVRPDPSGFYPEPDWIRNKTRGSLKLTWQVNARNKLQSLSFLNLDMAYNDGGNVGDELESRPEVSSTHPFTGLIWESLITDSLLLRSQVGIGYARRGVRPMRCRHEPESCLHVASIVQQYPRTIRLDNYQTTSLSTDTRFEAVNQLEWFAASKRLGEHSVKIRDDFTVEDSQLADSRNGDKILTFNGAMPVQIQEFYANDPRREPGRYGFFIQGSSSQKNVLSLSDSMRLGRYLTLTPGVSLLTARGSNYLGQEAINQTAVVPTAAVAWDATRDGRTVLRSSFSDYADIGVLYLAQHSAGSIVSRTCRWNELAQDYTDGCTWSGGGTSSRTYGLPCGPQGFNPNGTPCAEKLAIPRTREYTAGAERELVEGVALGTDFIYRKYENQYTTTETNRIWNDSGSQLDPNGGFRNGRNETVTDLGTPDTSHRRYVAVTTMLRKREGKLKTVFSYTWSRLEGTKHDVFNGSGLGQIPGRVVFVNGYLPDDHRHEIRAQTVYQLTRWLTTGLSYSYNSGMPYNRVFQNAVTNGRDDLRARIGADPGANINDPGDDRELRLPDIQSLNLQMRVNLQPLLGVRIESYADVLNVLALRTTTSVVEDDGPMFGRPVSRMLPFRVRLGLQARF